MSEPLDTVNRLLEATNRHDLDALVGCFADDYVLEMPAHPARGFRGADQVRRNWQQILAAVPDIKVTLLGWAVDGETVWTEQEMRGTRRDGSAHLMRGPLLFGVRAGRIRWGRFYIEPVEESGPAIDESVRAQVAR